MAMSSSVFLVTLVVTFFCVANAGRIPAEPGRKLVVADAQVALGNLVTVDLAIHFDLTQVVLNLGDASVSLKEPVRGAVKPGVVSLVAGKVVVLKAVKVKLQKPGVVQVALHLLGVDKVVDLDLRKLKATVVGGELKAVVVLVIDKGKKVLHLRNREGICNQVDVDIRIDFTA